MAFVSNIQFACSCGNPEARQSLRGWLCWDCYLEIRLEAAND